MVAFSSILTCLEDNSPAAEPFWFLVAPCFSKFWIYLSLNLPFGSQTSSFPLEVSQFSWFMLLRTSLESIFASLWTRFCISCFYGLACYPILASSRQGVCWWSKFSRALWDCCPSELPKGEVKSVFAINLNSLCNFELILFILTAKSLFSAFLLSLISLLRFRSLALFIYISE